MRLVYVDEAGLSNPEQEPFLVVVGAVVHGDSALNGIEANLRRIREKHIPERFGDDFVFHAFELFGGKGKWPAPGSEDTELGVFMGPEVSHGEAKVYAGVQS